MLFQQNRDQQFFQLLRSAAENSVETANLLNQLLNDPTRHPELGPAIKSLESKGDDLTHKLFALINKTFVTPLEREDLAALGTALDSVVDAMEAAAARIGIYKVQNSDRFLKTFGGILKSQSTELVAAMDLLAGGKLDRISDAIVRINDLENQGDEQLRSGLSDLYDNSSDTIRFITMKEIYETLEVATDQVEDVANTLEGVVMKHA